MRSHEQFDCLFWAGMFLDLDLLHKQIHNAVALRSMFRKKVCFIWERTGYDDVIPYDDLLDLLIWKGTDGIFTLNRGQHNTLLAHGVPDRMLHSLRPGVDTQLGFMPPSSLEERNQIRRQLQWSEEWIIGLWVGRLVRRKQVLFLAKTWSDTKDWKSTARLIIVGSGFDQASSVEAEICNLASSNESIIRLPHHDEISRALLYRAANYSVLAGELEGEPSVLVEAMASGLPIVASDIDGHTELVQNGITGILFPPNSGPQLQRALHIMIDDAASRASMGFAARKMAVEKRDISISVASLLDTFMMQTKDQQ